MITKALVSRLDSLSSLTLYVLRSEHDPKVSIRRIRELIRLYQAVQKQLELEPILEKVCQDTQQNLNLDNT